MEFPVTLKRIEGDATVSETIRTRAELLTAIERGIDEGIEVTIGKYAGTIVRDEKPARTLAEFNRRVLPKHWPGWDLVRDPHGYFYLTGRGVTSGIYVYRFADLNEKSWLEEIADVIRAEMNR